MRSFFIIAIMVSTFVVSGFSQFEQYIQEDPEPTSQNQAGATFSILESGSGFGAFYEWALPQFWYFGTNLNFYMLRDNGQIDYQDPYTGYPMSYGKVNNVYWIDLGVTVKKRLFTRSIDDQFRPFVSASVGPVYGMNYPEIKELDDQFTWAFSGGLAAGVDVVMDTGYLIGFELQYRLMRFGADLGEIQYGNYSTLDVRLELGKLF